MRQLRRLAHGTLCWGLLASAPGLAGAQEVAQARLQGRVVRGTDGAGVPSAPVTLHLVTADSSGQIDSLRAGAGGEFAFALPTVPDPLGRGEVYFASVTHQGILYVGPTVHMATQLDSVYLVEVHDTTMAPAGGAQLPLALRYLILEPSPGDWVVTDVIQLENTGVTTLVGREGEAVWRYPLPAGARDLQPGSGVDAPPEALRLEDGNLEVVAPIAPGVRQYMVRYRLGGERLDMRLPGSVRQIELLVREPAPVLSVEGLALNVPAEMEPGVTYRRFSGVEVQDGRVRVLPGTARRGLPLRGMAVMMGLLLAAVSLWAVQRDVPAAPLPASGLSPDPLAAAAFARREKLLLELAELDERAEPGLADEEARALASRRRALLEELRRLG